MSRRYGFDSRAQAVIEEDFERRVGRKPTDSEWKAMRRWVDRLVHHVLYVGCSFVKDADGEGS